MEAFLGSGAAPFSVGETRSGEELREISVWQKLEENKLFQFHSAISFIKFSPVSPFSVCALSGLSAPWINGNNHQHAFSFAKAKTPFSALAFRKNGELIALGHEDSRVDLYPVKDHQLLVCRLKLNAGIIHSLAFSPFGNDIVAGCGDGTIRICDIARLKEPIVISAHSDAVSAILPMSAGNIWISAGHDSRICLWDFNTHEKIAELTAPHQVLSLTLSNNRVFASSGENVLVFDVGSSLTPVADFVAHTRPITGLAIVRSNLVTASGDKTIKVFDSSSFNLLHTIKASGEITSFDAVPDGSAIAIAMTGGVVQLKYMSAVPESQPLQQMMAMPPNYRVFHRVSPNNKEKWNKLLAKFEVADALDETLKTKNPEIIVGMLDELDRIGKLETAISGRDAPGIEGLLHFLIENVTNPTWSHVVLKAVVAFEKIYKQVIYDAPIIGKLFETLALVIEEELNCQIKATQLVGKIELLIPELQ